MAPAQRTVLTEGRGDELGRVVQVNEAAKQLVDCAFEVGLLALNATLQSERYGGSLRGFADVSRHMKSWTHDLDVLLVQMRDDARTSVRAASVLIRQCHVADRLELAAHQAEEQSPLRASSGMRAAAERARQQVVDGKRALDAHWRRVFEHVRDLNRLGLMAVVLSRLAMIEAQCGNGERVRSDLSHVSQQFYAHSESVVSVLRTLSTNLGIAA